MLAKCITPICNSQFKYFGRGVLMMKKIDVKDGQLSADPELFWMCETCAERSLTPTGFVPLSRHVSREEARTKSLAA